MTEQNNEMNDVAIPAHGERCTDVLSDTLRGYAGIEEAEFELEAARLRVMYDPRILSDENAMRLVRQAASRAGGRVAHCALKSDAACLKCSQQLQGELVRHYRQPETPAGTWAAYHGGLLEVQLNPALLSQERATVEQKLAVREAAPAEKPAGLPRASLEVIFTVVTLASTVLAYVGSRIGVAEDLITGLYVLAFAAGGYYGLIDGVKALQGRRLDVNLLMILAALGAAFVGQPAEGAVLLFLFSLSNTLQSYAMGRSRKAIEKLLNLRPAQATVRRGSRLQQVPIEKLILGDVVVVRPGERFPIDGEILSGDSDVDQSTITGESVPVHKDVGDSVFASTVNGNGSLEIRVTRLAKDTTLARIVAMVEDAQAAKAQTERMLDRFEQIYALFVLGGAVLLIAFPLLILKEAFYPVFYRAMTWLVVASPCALVISTPASILSAIANGARHGVLFKGGIHLERTAQLKVVAFDKTGTLTHGSPSLTGVYPATGVAETELLRVTAALESRSEHPLGKGIVKGAQERGLDLPEATDFRAVPGQGIEGRVGDKPLWVGGERLFAERGVILPENVRIQMHHLEEEGQTVMLVNSAGTWLGMLSVADTLREDAAGIIHRLKSQGIERVVMLTGDNERVAAGIARKAGVDEFHAGLLPQDKVSLLKSLRQKYGLTAMIGDGVNDAPALATADVGVAMGGAGTDVAMETADVVLMADNLGKLPHAIGLARQARSVVFQNLTFALAVIVVLVTSAFGAYLPLPLGVVGHEGSTVLVVLNGLRLLAYRV
ncbi:MAG: cadmium-translocating P-type ATPase [Chloroflexi bacterium]|nr:cadmium-translocating P-type ATPase [Chloroflexota bacterium]